MDIIVDPAFEKFLIPLRAEEREQLESLLLKDGCRDPLVVWAVDGKRILVDGHNRFDICTKHNIPFKTTELELADRDAVEDWIDANQLGRRNLPLNEYKIVVGRRYNRAKKRAQDNLKKGNANSPKPQVEDSGQTQEKQRSTSHGFAEQEKLSHATVERHAERADVHDKLFEKGEKDAAEKAKAIPQKSVNKASKVLKDESKPEPERVKQAAKIIEEAAKPRQPKNRSSGKKTVTQKVIAKAGRPEVIAEVLKLCKALSDKDYLLLMETLANTRMIGTRRSIDVVYERLGEKRGAKPNQQDLFKDTPSELPIPEAINTKDVEEAWRTWCEHLKEKKFELTNQEAAAQLKQLARSKPKKVVQIIEYAIASRMTSIPMAKDLPEDLSELELDEILAFAKRRELDINHSIKFYRHYASQGWKKGNGQPLTNWKHQLEEWCASNASNNNGARFVPGDEVKAGLI